MSVQLILEFAVLIGALFLGVRAGGVGLGLWGAVGLLVLLFGRFVIKLHPVILLGGGCGGQTVAAGLSAVNEEADSPMPVLGFTVTHAISNVLLACVGR